LGQGFHDLAADVPAGAGYHDRFGFASLCRHQALFSCDSAAGLREINVAIVMAMSVITELR
jgi:hypothetical protein